ncbi:MAG: pentapeptide repeat-containing protein [Microcoleus anatoxicus]|uniref:pentapeptide repeat-containing protein n=1 Tax=Microcoleus anatoxicus TaxID=2705319 RepID=UPI00367190BA
MSSLTFHNFRHQNLQGRSFKGEVLTNEDFSYADIRGADFTNATLNGANFHYARCGIARKSQIKIFIIVALLSAISGIAAVIAVDNTFKSLIPKTTEHIGFLPTAIILLVNAMLLTTIIRQGIQKALDYLGIAAAIFVPLIGFLSAFSNDKHPILSWLRSFRTGALMSALSGETKANDVPFLIVTLTAAVVATTIAIVALPLALTLAEIVLGRTITALALFESVAISAIATGIIARNSLRYLKASVLIQAGVVDNTNNKCYDFLNNCVKKFPDPPVVILAIAGAVMLAVALILLGNYIAKRVLAEDDKYSVIRQLAIIIGAMGGTSFRNTQLAHTNFSNATLKNTDFRFANIHRTMWHHARFLDWARVDETILINPAVRDLLVTGNGYHKSYQGMDLRGANLIGANLSYAKLQTADLSQATLEAANLEYAIFSQVQAIGTDFSSAQMTGVCGLGTWNIDSTTELEWVDCRWVYLLEEPKPETDDRERRPSGKDNYQPGEFTTFFEEVINTVDLIFNHGFDWKAFVESFQQVQVENQGIPLNIQSIENKRNAVVVKVSLPPDADKEKIHNDFNFVYQEMLRLARREVRFLQNSAEQSHYLLSVMEDLVRPLSEQVVTLKIERGDLKQGFEVSADILCDRQRLEITLKGKLPPKPEISKNYQKWQEMYEFNLKRNNRAIKVNKGQINNFSIEELKPLVEQVEIDVKNWLKSEQFYPIQQELCEKLNHNDEVRVIIETEDNLLRKLPWHQWEFFNNYCKAEVALSRKVSNRVKKSVPSRKKVRILAIFGASENLNLDEDRQILKNLPGAETIFLEKPSRQLLEQYLTDQTGWDILSFSGHSESEVDGSTGVICINDTDNLTVEQLKDSLKIAIQKGLEIAIFNSCDGLGLAKQLEDLDIPQIIVMRELVPDLIAQEFLRIFLQAFAGGNSFYVSVREARKHLKDNYDGQIPGVSWLPVICQNKAEFPKTWQKLQENG